MSKDKRQAPGIVRSEVTEAEQDDMAYISWATKDEPMERWVTQSALLVVRQDNEQARTLAMASDDDMLLLLTGLVASLYAAGMLPLLAQALGTYLMDIDEQERKGALNFTPLDPTEN